MIKKSENLYLTMSYCGYNLRALFSFAQNYFGMSTKKDSMKHGS